MKSLYLCVYMQILFVFLQGLHCNSSSSKSGYLHYSFMVIFPAIRLTLPKRGKMTAVVNAVDIVSSYITHLMF